MKRYISPALEVVMFHAECSMMLSASDPRLPQKGDDEETNIKDSNEIWTKKKRWSSSWEMDED